VIVQAAIFTPYGPDIVVVLAPSSSTGLASGNALIARVQPHFPTSPIMLVSIEENGFRAHATFQTARLLALLQLELLSFAPVDLDEATQDQPLPF
jgi:hypothetical protein